MLISHKIVLLSLNDLTCCFEECIESPLLRSDLHQRFRQLIQRHTEVSQARMAFKVRAERFRDLVKDRVSRSDTQDGRTDVDDHTSILAFLLPTGSRRGAGILNVKAMIPKKYGQLSSS